MGKLKCGECSYYEFDSYSNNSNEKNLFHNVIIIHTVDKAISWFLYDDNNFSTYVFHDNLNIDEHSQKHVNTESINDSQEKEKLETLAQSIEAELKAAKEARSKGIQDMAPKYTA